MGPNDHTATNRSTYDRIARAYAEKHNCGDPSKEDWFSGLQDAFLASLPVEGLLADLGCGPGTDGSRFAKEGYRVIGMDLSAGMLSIAARGLVGRLAQADLRALPVDCGRLDGIWCVAALLHVPEQDTDQVLREFRRTLRHSGSLALVTALGESSRFEAVPYAPDEQRWFVYRHPDRLREQLRVAGFRIRMEDQAPGNRVWLTVLAQAA